MIDRTLATLFSSDPPDGTHLLVWRGDDTPTVIWRRDAAGVGQRRWFDEWHQDEPSTLREMLTGADDVMLLVKLDQAGRREVDAVFARVMT